ncbi:DUF1254 domain-containing protein [Raineyella fluvialis]|uniref:DUF1254 domain-containing protein n=1 Tax=Raineyella fluvialis TaxID=2662261 RepID=A0A5Q2FCI8_9ACTN|nr:DUF1254 domain-containing protein [Raineyella fluvialis]QGF23467.1 DUF1254 domain-containing protein [Raineyella fluvialis]
MRLEHLLTFGVVALVTWFGFLYFWPRLLLTVFKRGLLRRGLGNGPVPVNTLDTQPAAQFADPLHTPTSGSRLMSVGVNRDTILTAGWLDLRQGPLVLHVPDMDGRYYSVQFTDPSTNTTFAYVGKRTTGTGAGDFLITGPGWSGQVPSGMQQIASPRRSVLVIGRVLVLSDSDIGTAHDLSRQLRLTPHP